ncbi:kinase-like domain-containing protein [Kickxella alabastrina]|uniref:kinase-like domain-containing protein n=1 Tax=Kickxella alabastrina TaxID=61397 RepID=UPI00221EE3EA|nr:kinase-like domain-containing protein [Kickxella alabastrina]KAI7825468.1 kinase-like domain-containing protein [Kickxella alabastrina]
MSTGPSPLFMPLQASPRLVAQMTGLSLSQSQLEVSQQHNLKRMLRRIRASRQKTITTSPRIIRRSSTRRRMPSISLPSSAIPAATANKPAVDQDNSSEWSDDREDDDDAALRQMDISMDISDNPPADVLSERIATLFNQVFAPHEEIHGEHVRASRLSGAMTNCVYMVEIIPAPTLASSSTSAHVRRWTRNKPQEGPVQLPAKYLLRVYGAGVDEFLSREKELYWLAQLTSLGFGPRLYGIFGNGRLEDKQIARRMCELHSLVSYYRPFDSRGHHHRQQQQQRPGIDLMHAKWDRVLQACSRNPQCLDILEHWTRVQQVAATLRQLTEARGFPIVFAHDDLQYGNILRLRDTGELVVVDFEYAGYNYRGFDIANHFCEWMADYHHVKHPHLLNESAYPDKNQREGFLRTYVKAKAFLDANMKADVGLVESDDVRHIELREIKLGDARIAEEVARLEDEVALFVPASHLHWGVWGLLQACSSDIDFDYVAYATQRLSIFLRLVSQMKK